MTSEDRSTAADGRSRWRGKAARGLLAAIVATSVAACALPDSTPMPVSDDPKIFEFEFGAGVGFPDTKANQPFLVGDLTLCLDRPGSITIDRVDSVQPFGGLRLEDFAMIPFGFDDGSRNYTIAQLGLSPKDDIVRLDRVCPDELVTPSVAVDPTTPPLPALLLQYSKPEPATAGNEGIVIHYSSNGHPHSVQMRWFIVLCAPSGTAPEHPSCARVGEPTHDASQKG